MALYTIETRKNFNGYDFANTWHIDGDNQASGVAAALALADFEMSLMTQAVLLTEIKLSTWPNPTNQNFWILTPGGSGARALTNVQPAATCLLLKIGALGGHSGKKWLRMALDETEVVNVAGKPRLTNITSLTGAFTDALTDLQASMDVSGWSLMIGSLPGTARQSNGDIYMAGVGYRDMDVGWYNKAQPEGQN